MDEVLVYRKHMNLKLAAEELGMVWQTLYVHLKKLGEPVIGDKNRYGSPSDKLSRMAEKLFQELVPLAEDQNSRQYQTKVDFLVNGYFVDVKSSLPRMLNKRFSKYLSWSFSFKKQSFISDFMCCFCLNEEKQIERVLLIPKELFDGLQTISVPRNGNSKWIDYEVSPDDLAKFFEELPEQNSQDIQ